MIESRYSGYLIVIMGISPTFDKNIFGTRRPQLEFLFSKLALQFHNNQVKYCPNTQLQLVLGFTQFLFCTTEHTPSPIKHNDNLLECQINIFWPLHSMIETATAATSSTTTPTSGELTSTNTSKTTITRKH